MGDITKVFSYKKKFLLILIILLFLFANVSSASNYVKNVYASRIAFSIDKTNDAPVPEWAPGNKWIYDFDFYFVYDILHISGAINDMTLEVEGVDLKNDEYILNIIGDLDSQLSIMGVLPGGSFTGDVKGTVHIQKSTLAIKDFVFNCYGSVSLFETFATVGMTFNPPFNFFDFPIESDEDINNPWPAETFATIDGVFDVGVIHYEFEVAEPFENEELFLVGEEQHEVNDKIYDCYLIRGSMGPGNGGVSNLWYSPDVGYLVDIKETIYDWEGVDATLNMPLKYTNYIVDNKPPNIPEIPSGETDILAAEDYSYSATTIDEEGDDIYYFFDWGDGTDSGWLGPYPSGTSISATHHWTQTGVYNIKVKAKDTNDVESLWSKPLPVTAASELPVITIFMSEINKIDSIDYSYPWDLEGYLPEWYYRLEVISSDLVSADTNYNTDDETKNGAWIHNFTWEPKKTHEFLVETSRAVLTIKLMDHDEWYELGDDLADVSGSYNDGEDNKAENEIRGAIYHGTYNLVTNDFEPYSEDPNLNSDYLKLSNNFYLTSGDLKPDSSINYDGNDASVKFWVYDNYEPPIANFDYQPEKPREKQDVQFEGKVSGGASTQNNPYKWQWYLGDGTESKEQNPVHNYKNDGKYTVTLIVTDALGETYRFEETIEIAPNQAPETPEKPSGPSSGSSGKTYSYSSYTTDPDHDKLYYLFDWGDGTDSGWLGPYDSDEMMSTSHKWTSKGSYDIRVKAKDEFNYESTWSETNTVSMPKSKNSNLILDLLQKFSERYILLESLLKLFLFDINGGS